MFLFLIAKGYLLDFTNLRGNEGMMGSLRQFSLSSGGREGVLGVLMGLAVDAASFSLDWLYLRS